MTVTRQKKMNGFTVFELVMVVVLLGIISVFALGRLFDSNDFKAAGYFNDALNATRYAQKLALSSGCSVQVQISGTEYALFQRETDCTTGAFTRAVLNPADRSKEYRNDDIPVGHFINASSPDFEFNAQGTLVNGLNISVTLQGENARIFLIDAQTGLVSVQ